MSQVAESNSSVRIVKPLINVCVLENQSVSLKCKVLYSKYELWFKNGNAITGHDKHIHRIKDEPNYTLLIESCNLNDTGVYTIICSDNNNSVECKAIVTVTPKIDAVFYSTAFDPRKFGVITPLKNVTAVRGRPVVLFVQFKAKTDKTIYWYKNNKSIESNRYIEINSTGSSSELVIFSADIDDTGVYTAVIDYGTIIDSNYCEVRIIDQLQIIEEATVPAFIDTLPKEFPVNDNEEVRVICKVSRNEFTQVKWFENGSQINFNNETHVREYYGPDYIAMRILKPVLGNQYHYKVCLRNDEATSTQSFQVVVKNPPMKSAPIVDISKKLEVVVTTVGQQVMLDCIFSVEKDEFYYIIWRLGIHTIERSNENFNVVYQNGRCLLHVKQVDYGMDGPFECELRLYVPYNQSICVSKSIGHLVLVPPIAITRFIARSLSPESIKIFKRYNNYVIKIQRCQINDIDENVEKVDLVGSVDLVMEIIYCRLDRKHYYVDTIHPPRYKDVALVIKDRSRVMGDDKPIALEFVWFGDIFRDKEIHFQIELHTDKQSKVIGITDCPTLKIANTNINDMIRISISAVVPNPEVPPSEILIDVREIEEQYWSTFYKTHQKRHVYNNMRTFRSFYKKIDCFIGSGSSGWVCLMEGKITADKTKLYAGKTVRLSNKNKCTNAQYEYNILQDLEHKNIVFMNCMLQTKSTFIFIFDYYWGGELFDIATQNRRLAEADLVFYVKQICNALAYLHENSIAHLDIKSENILLEHPNSRNIKLIDFGISRRYTKGHGWISKSVVGTKSYLAPEMILCALVSGDADMWSLGVLIYILLTREEPFPNNIWLKYLKDAPADKNTTDNVSMPPGATSSTSVHSISLETLNVEDSSNTHKPTETPDSSMAYAIPSFESSSSCSVPIAQMRTSLAGESELPILKFFYNNPSLEDVSLAGKDFLSQLLIIDNTKRMKSENALKHPWLKYGPSKFIQSGNTIRSKSESIKYKPLNKHTLKKVATTITALSYLQKSTHRTRETEKDTEKDMNKNEEPSCSYDIDKPSTSKGYGFGHTN